MFKNKIVYNGYRMLKDILDEEKSLGLYQGRAAIIAKQERYFDEEIELDINGLDSPGDDEVPF